MLGHPSPSLSEATDSCFKEAIFFAHPIIMQKQLDRTPPGDRDWDEIYRLSKLHGLSGWLYRRLQGHAPHRIEGRLKEEWIKNWLRHQQFLLSLEEIRRALPDAIELSLLKGMALVPDLYHHPGERFMSDIDLLIRPQDLEGIEPVLISLGYQKRNENNWKANHHKQHFTRLAHGIEVTLEFHTQVFAAEPAGHRWRFEKSPVMGYGRLALEDHLVFLSGHIGYQHTFARLMWLLDIHLLIDRHLQAIDWDWVFLRAKNLEMLDSLCLTLTALSQCYQTPIGKIPFQTGISKKIKSHMAQAILQPEFLLHPQSWKYFTIKHLTKDRWLDAFRYDYHWSKQKIKETIRKRIEAPLL